MRRFLKEARVRAMCRHARIVLRQLRISGQAASLRAATNASMSEYRTWFTETKRRLLGDHLAWGAVMLYESGGGGAVELEFVVLDKNRAYQEILSFRAPEVSYGGAMIVTASKIVFREQSQAGQSTGGWRGGSDQAHHNKQNTT